MFKFPPNKKYSGEIYNERRKERFLEDGNYEGNTKESYRNIFYSSYKEEERLEKDLADFNLDEIGNIIANLEPLTELSARGKISIIERYIKWATHKGLREGSNMNPFDFAPADYASQFINKNKKLFFSWSDIYEEIIPGLVNYQDKVILTLLFEGVEGHDLSEIRFLKKTDVDFENKELHLTEKKGDTVEERTLEVSDETIEIIQGAIDERRYEKSNGNMKESDDRRLSDYSDLVETGMVIKLAKTRTAIFGAAESTLIRGRLKAIKKYFDIEILTSQNVVKSGQIYMGYLLWKRDGVLDKEQYIEICERFNIPKINNHGYETYPWGRLKEWVNLDNIKEMYKEA